ncbi:hypothetical protein BU17DRAFT_72646 [Hysterangium stoloniferum]|nr:hypothetical protein BU17DRAFT_72646 [Hysterangium stoloniferum]
MPWFYTSHQSGNLKPQQPVTKTLWRSLGAYVQMADILGPVGMVMPNTPEEDGTSGTQEVPRSLPRSDSQLRFENVIAMTTWRSILPVRTVTFKRIGSSPVDCGLYTRSMCKIADYEDVQVGWRLKMLLWKFAEAVGEAVLYGSSMEGQGSIASIEDTGPFKETQSPSQLSAG